ncbi:hypothetical protein B0H21DRAFT_867145 [Amylocystis lapponica]|nr:hypothetical protein B0H21DRAFT_825949 [Amylocystis lapponica]KAH9942835.1 hypothetical protein B0H21DRAFT_867145 [Amylocystis lapponica]
MRAAEKRARIDAEDIEMEEPDPAPAPVPEAPAVRPSGRPARPIRLPKRYQDAVPPVPSTLPPAAATPVDSPQPPALSPHVSMSPSPEPVHQANTTVTTEPDSFGVYRSYSHQPTYDPEDLFSLEDVCDSDRLATSERGKPPQWSGFGSAMLTKTKEFFAPFLNPSTFRLMSWFYNGRERKSIADLDDLVQNVILSDDFQPTELEDFRTATELRRIDKHLKDSTFSAADGWHEASVKFRVPPPARDKRASERTAAEYTVEEVYYRKPLEVIRTALRETAASKFHFFPFRQFWKATPSSSPERLYGELYTADAMIAEHDKIQAQPREAGCTLETVVAAIMLYSDSTHLANFGTAALWPMYAFIGNQSKYIRAKPTSFAAHHLAYIPKLLDSFQEFYRAAYNTVASSAVLTHCKRELMHAILELLLDDEFMYAYEHGTVMEFADGVMRRVFPRIFTYSADYPEKILLACIKYLGKCPCPRCKVEKDKISQLGTRLDSRLRSKLARVDTHARRFTIEGARQWIYKGWSFVSKRIEDSIGVISMVPTRNAFSTRLYKFGYNFYSMFVPDLLHEFELGVWKATFTHLLRILYAWGRDTIQELNRRYRQVPTFGRDTIRRFNNNASGMKKLAARDFEDLLQCALPVFEILLPYDDDTVILNLLFDLATWHAYAKLRLHSDTTLQFFEGATAALGNSLRKFAKTTCERYVTMDLPQEEAARGRRKAAKAAKGGSAAKPTESSKKVRKFNLSTYKLHALGDYPQSIRDFGTTDGTSTQVGELEHRRVKRFFARTSKQKYTAQIVQHHRRERLLGKDRTTQKKRDHRKRKQTDQGPQAALEEEALPYTNPTDHYHISVSDRSHEHIPSWLRKHAKDPALKDFLPRLKDHLLARLLGHTFDGDETDYSDAERASVVLVNDRLYQHSVLRINYTTYDMRRDQDSINPRTHADIMVLSHEDPEGDPHPYWYARVVGVFHVYARQRGSDGVYSEPTRLVFLWVRWYGLDMDHLWGWKAKRLPRVGFLDNAEPGAFGFLDPEQVIRAVHLIPAFAYGRTAELLSPSIVRSPADEDKDWQYYYVNIFVDRDMFMRFRGGGVGHHGIREISQRLLRKDAVRTEEEVDPSSDESSDESSEPKCSSDNSNDSDGNGSKDNDNEGNMDDESSEDDDKDVDGSGEDDEEDDFGYGLDTPSDSDEEPNSEPDNGQDGEESDDNDDNINEEDQTELFEDDLYATL